MKTKTLSLTTILGFLGLLVMIHTMSANAHASPTLKCTSTFGEKIIVINQDTVSFIKYGASRSISSTDQKSVRTQIKDKGFIKTLYQDGNKHKIHVKNSKELSELNDYLSITSPKGHEMTYPLNCHSV